MTLHQQHLFLNRAGLKPKKKKEEKEKDVWMEFIFWYFPDPTGCHVYFPKIHLVTNCAWSTDPAGQQECVHQIHLILKSVFSHIVAAQCVCVLL